MILVIGGRSKIGAAVIGGLTERGESVRALARSSEAADSLPNRVEPVTGDLGDPGALRQAMRGVDRVFLLSGPHPDEVQWHRNAIDAAGESGVDWFVRSSILGADPDSPATFIRDHGQCDEYLQRSGVRHAIVRPNLFQQNVPENTIPSIDENGNFYVNAGEARISMVDARDVGAVAAALLTRGDPGGEICEVTGPDALSYADVAEKLSSSLGRPATYVDVPDDVVRQTLLGFGMDGWMVNALVELYQDYKRSGADGYAAEVTSTVEDLTGSPARSLDQLLSDQVS
jgi:uncharacterized protein YbjT (DUF2867 family)